MATQIDICNSALGRVGQPPLLSINDEAPAAQRATREFSGSLGVVLRAYPWPFAVQRAKLAVLAEKPAFGYEYYYALPANIARIINVYCGGEEYQIEGSSIATNAESVSIRYVSKDVNLALMDDAVADCVALELAARLAVPITENPQLKQQLYEEYKLALREAMHVWSLENYPQHVIEGPWLEAHNGAMPQVPLGWNPWGPNGDGV